ncbi:MULTISPECIES: hypothetical protein [Methanobacterium]|jgi:hypothetical protein|uniref:Uncharacterized protein n=1 Tax=Methanobacterium veterum TaxID=408577 RepID=A0A9E5A1D5_9EURY|nr:MULTISPECIES: hypothetical protein [Methanobacterium]MCZ3365062.1 hypothetical protein [Methanobacterium veterum]MCZ3372817.1 hypothetical protein [Methanobacterium veterum]
MKKSKEKMLFVTLGGNRYEDTLDSMSKEIEEKGGNVIKTIAITKTNNKTEADIANEINQINI